MKDQFSLDSIGSSRIRLLQPKGGYRFSLDAVLLAHFIKTDPDEVALEIGCGNGVVLVLVSHLQKFKRVIGIEVQQELAELAQKNVELNKIKNAEILHGDFREMTLPEQSFDLIFANPPYRKLGTGKLNPKEQKAIARHEVKMKLENLFDCSNRLLKKNGRITLILPSFRDADWKEIVQAHGYHWKERKSVCSFEGEPPAFVLGSVSTTAGDLIQHPDLIIYDAPGVYTAEMQKLLNWKHSL